MTMKGQAIFRGTKEVLILLSVCTIACNADMSSVKYRLVKRSNECKSSDKLLGKNIPSASICAQLCEHQPGCKFFILGFNGDLGKCYWEKTNYASCPEGWDHDTYNFYELTGCQDTDNGAHDRGGDGCDWYSSSTSRCGDYDDSDFSANQMCCSCGGGSSEVVYKAPPTEGGSCGDANDDARHRYCRYIGASYTMCQEVCNTDHFCKGYSMIPSWNRCYIYTTSDCPHDWFVNNEDYTTGPLRTLPDTVSVGEVGCFIKEE